MQDKLKSIEKRYMEIEELLQDSDLYQNPERAAALLKEQKEIEPVVTAFRTMQKAQDSLTQARELYKESKDDPELRQMAQLEEEECLQTIADVSEEIKILLLPRDKDDDKNTIVEIRGGVGGDEAALFAADLYRMYSMYAEKRRFSIDVMNINETEIGGIKEISFVVEGRGAWSRFKFESGTHRVQRVPDTESSGRIHTSAVTVAVLPEAEEVEIDINPADLQIDTFRSSGAGGQHVNKTESAIRVTHIPSGVVVECQDERSQHKNRDRALKILRSKLYEAKQREVDSQRADTRKSQVGTGDRSGRIRTYNFPQGRVTDHRIGLTLHKLDMVMNGDLDEIIDALAADHQAQLLSNTDQ